LESQTQSLQKTVLLPDFPNSPFQGYAVNYLNKHFWRVQVIFGDFEDALSEACLVYYECRRLYGSRVTTRAHFMALYKRMMHSWFTDWANYDTKVRNYHNNLTDAEEITEPEANLTALLNDASGELKTVLQVIINAPSEIAATLRDDAKRGVDRFFQHAAELAHVPPDHVPQLKTELYSLLT